MEKVASEIGAGDCVVNEDGAVMKVLAVENISRMYGSGYIRIIVDKPPGHAVVHENDIVRIAE